MTTSTVQIQRMEPEMFHSIQEHNPNPFVTLLDLHECRQSDRSFWGLWDMETGYWGAVAWTRPNGEVGGLQSFTSGDGSTLLRYLIDRGLAFHLDCLGDVLVDYYRRHGFHVHFRGPWDDEQAPPGWDYAAHGRPDYVEMSLREVAR